MLNLRLTKDAHSASDRTLDQSMRKSIRINLCRVVGKQRRWRFDREASPQVGCSQPCHVETSLLPRLEFQFQTARIGFSAREVKAPLSLESTVVPQLLHH